MNVSAHTVSINNNISIDDNDVPFRRKNESQNFQILSVLNGSQYKSRVRLYCLLNSFTFYIKYKKKQKLKRNS